MTVLKKFLFFLRRLMGLKIYSLLGTPKEPPQQKSFWTSTMTRALDISCLYYQLQYQLKISHFSSDSAVKILSISKQNNWLVIVYDFYDHFDCLDRGQQKQLDQNLHMSDKLRNHVESTLVQDTQVEGQTCCHSILRSRSAKNNTIKVISPFNKHKTNVREKGIKITHCNSLNSLNNKHSSPSLKLKLSMNLKDSLPLIKKIKTCETADSVHQPQTTKFKVNKKCLDYKNRIILEHSLKPEQIISSEPEVQQLSFSPRKTQGNMSTQLNTPRQTKQISFNLFQSVNPSIIVNVIEQRTVENEDVSQSEEKKEEGISLTLRKSRKTIEKLYQLQAGRKMQVFESEMSEVSQEDIYSIVESFIWN